MSEHAAGGGKLLSGHRLFTLFKYSIYLLLIYNAWVFYEGDVAASAEVFGNTITWRNVVEAYSATFDSFAWIVLMLAFELETAVIPDDKLTPRVDFVLLAVSAVCYFFIVYAFIGYFEKYQMLAQVQPVAWDTVCGAARDGWNYIATLDDYPPMDAAACAALQGQELLRVVDQEIIGSVQSHHDALNLAAIDVINAAAWLVIVVLLEGEVWLQSKQILTGRMLLISKALKGVFYLALAFCAVYWALYSNFVDGWDAFLWLLAFVFIELNVFHWYEETEEAREEAAAGEITPAGPPSRP